MGLHKYNTWGLVKKTYGTTQNWHMNACEKDIWDYKKLAHECLWKTHMGLHKYGTSMLVKKAYGTTQNWHMNACEKHIWDYTNMTHECLWKRHVGLHKIGAWMLMKKTYGTTQSWHMNNCFLLFVGNFGNKCLAFCHAKFLLPNKEKNVITRGKEILERRIFFCTYNCFDQRMPNHSYNFFNFCHVGVWIDGVPYQSKNYLSTCLVKLLWWASTYW